MKNIQKRLKAGYLLCNAAVFAAVSFMGCGTAAPPDTAAAAPSSVDAAANAPDGQEQAAGTAPVPSFTVSPLNNASNTITVNSSEKVSVIPDIAEVVYAVRTEAKEASACQQKNTEDINQVISLLKNLGVAESSIQTTDYFMHPIYNYSNNTQRITGYEATSTLTVSGLPIDSLGTILTESVNAGINNIQSVTYQSGRYDEAYAEALRLAVTSAKAKADALAEAGGCTVGSIASIRENSNYGEARYTDYALAGQIRSYGAAQKEMALEDSAAIMPGELAVDVNITVEYFIQ